MKITDEYKEVKQLPASLLSQQGPVGPARPKEQRKMITAGRESISTCRSGINNTGAMSFSKRRH